MWIRWNSFHDGSKSTLIISTSCFDNWNMHAFIGWYNWNICKRNIMAYSRKLGQHLILAQKSTFLGKKNTKNLTTPYSMPFLSVLHQNKALHNFHKRGKRLNCWMCKKSRSRSEYVWKLKTVCYEVYYTTITVNQSHLL